MAIETNPVLIDLVIERVVSYLAEKDLKSCRLLCKKWYSASTKALQKNARNVKFGELYYRDVMHLRPDIDSIKRFLSNMNEAEVLSFVKFDLKPNILSERSLPQVEEFFGRFGPQIEELIVNLAYESADSFSEASFPGLNLKSLEYLYFCHTIKGELDPSLTNHGVSTRHILLERLLRAAPNLTTLHLWCDSENLTWPGQAIPVLEKVGAAGDLSKLKDLKISFPMSNEDLIGLAKICVALRSLTFFIREPSIEPETFRKVLEAQGNSLEKLRLVDLQCRESKVIEIPLMPMLRELEIEGAFYGDKCRLSLAKFSFQNVPSLEKLILRNCHCLNFDLESLLHGSSVCHSLKQLHCIIAHDFVNDEYLWRISKIFPSLKNLHVMFPSESKELLRSVFHYFSDKLEHLTINVRRCGDNIDNILTGELAQPEVGIYSLKQLKRLELKGEFGNYKSENKAISDRSHFAFLQTQSLRELVLTNTGLNLSNESFSALKNKLNVIVLYPASKTKTM